jgi:glycosyltransferase involved in cell wall biosynthesis
MEQPHPNPAHCKVLLLSQYSLPFLKRNMNVYQRVFFGAKFAQIRLMIRKQAEVSEELSRCVEIHRAPVQSRWAFFFYCVFAALVFRLRGWSRIATEPSGFAGVGFLAKYLGNYTWAMDVWDRPRWRTGQHEDDGKLSWSDQLVFWLMRHADLYLLSVLPEAAKDMAPPSAKSVQLFNAIDRENTANAPRHRETGANRPLRVCYARSKFWGTMGLSTLIAAAEKLKDRGGSVAIHLVGEVPPSEKAKVDASRAAEMFRLEGFVSTTRAEFFRSMDVGLIPYEDFEDLRYIFPIKVLEHLAQGNPVIGSRLPGIEFMVRHEFNGLLVPPGDASALADAMLRLQNDVPLFNRLAANALKSSYNFDPHRKNQLIYEAIALRRPPATTFRPVPDDPETARAHAHASPAPKSA